MKILVSTDGRHGSTASLGDELARVFTADGAHVDTVEPESVGDTTGYDAVVIGSAVYSGRWMPSVKKLVSRLASSPHPPIWLFSCGPLHSSNQPVNETPDSSWAAKLTNPLGQRTFSGCLDLAQLSWGERCVVQAAGALDGDFREWDRVRAWAEEILASAHSAVDPRADAYTRPS